MTENRWPGTKVGTKDPYKAVVFSPGRGFGKGWNEMTKAEYVRMYPHSAEFCWCCSTKEKVTDWDTCECGFYESTPKCPKCGHGLQCCCVCLAVGGPLSKMLDAVKDGTMTEAEALARLERGSEPAAYKQKRQTTVATTKDTKDHVFYLMNNGEMGGEV